MKKLLGLGLGVLAVACGGGGENETSDAIEARESIGSTEPQVVCMASACTVYETPDMATMTPMAKVPYGRVMGVLGRKGSRAFVSVPMSDRGNRVQAVFLTESWVGKHLPHDADKMICENTACSVQMTADLEHYQPLSTAPHLRSMGVLGRKDGVYFVSIPMPDRGNKVQAVNSGGGWEFSGKIHIGSSAIVDGIVPDKDLQTIKGVKQPRAAGWYVVSVPAFGARHMSIARWTGTSWSTSTAVQAGGVCQPAPQPDLSTNADEWFYPVRRGPSAAMSDADWDTRTTNDIPKIADAFMRSKVPYNAFAMGSVAYDANSNTYAAYVLRALGVRGSLPAFHPGSELISALDDIWLTKGGDLSPLVAPNLDVD